MIYFTSYAQKKFELLNDYKVFITKEQVLDTLNLPDKTTMKGKYLFSYRDGLAVVSKKGGEIVTFYPVKQTPRNSLNY